MCLFCCCKEPAVSPYVWWMGKWSHAMLLLIMNGGCCLSTGSIIMTALSPHGGSLAVLTDVLQESGGRPASTPVVTEKEISSKVI